MTTAAASKALVAGYLILDHGNVVSRKESGSSDHSRISAINEALQEVAGDRAETISKILDLIGDGEIELIEVRRSLTFTGETKVTLNDFENTDFTE